MPALVYLVAAFAMVFSALNFKEMAKEYLIAGSVYSYVRLGANRPMGFVAGISTLNEVARGGGPTVSKATMIVLYAITVIFVLQVYLAAIFIPTGTVLADGDAVNNAFYNIAGDVVGPWFKPSLLTRCASCWTAPGEPSSRVCCGISA